jgi:hypothetical protein
MCITMHSIPSIPLCIVPFPCCPGAHHPVLGGAHQRHSRPIGQHQQMPRTVGAGRGEAVHFFAVLFHWTLRYKYHYERMWSYTCILITLLGIRT